MDTFSPPASYIAKARDETWTNFSVLRHGRYDGVLVTSKNSGTHWLKYMLAVALAHEHGAPPPAYFSENGVRPYIGGPKDMTAFAGFPKIAFSHTIPHRLADWRWARRMAGLPPYVLAVRHPMQILASHHAKWEYDIKVGWLDYLRGDPAGTRYRCDIYWLARFWNRWGEIKARYPDDVLTVHYEATQADPRAILEAINAHWALGLSVAAIDTALAAGTKDAMALKVDPHGEVNVLQNRQTPLRDLFSGEALELYRTRVAALFRHDLGYDLLNLP